MAKAFLCVLLFVCGASYAAEPLERRYTYQPSANSPRFAVVETHNSDDPYAQQVRIFSSDGKRVLLESDAYRPSFGQREESRSLIFKDLNGDGYKDVLVVVDDAVRNTAYSLFLYEPKVKKLIQASRFRNGEAGALFMHPTWEPRSGSLNEYVHNGSAGAEFNQNCSRWEGLVAKPYLSVTSELLKRRDEDEDWRTKLTITQYEQGAKSVRSKVFLGEQFAQRFFSEKARQERCAMWAHEFERMSTKQGRAKHNASPSNR